MTTTLDRQSGRVDPHKVVAAFDSSRIKSQAAEQSGEASEARVMIVDDEAFNILVVRKLLSAMGFSKFSTTTKPAEAMDLLRADAPDIVLLDVMMPEISGLDLLKMMQGIPPEKRPPVIILTASAESSVRTEALNLGAADFLNKPVYANELLPRIRNVLAAKALRDHLARQSEELERLVAIRTRELEISRQEVVLCLARASEFRDNDTAQHVIRVGRYSRLIAEQLGCDPELVERIEVAAQLHDVGKVGVSDNILLKPGKLDPEEFDLMRKHCSFGHHILRPIEGAECMQARRHTDIGAQILDVDSSPLLKMASVIAQTHHERWDGTGYPLGLAGGDIPIAGRITSVADVYDALSSERPYKTPFPRERCFAILDEGRGTQFDPQVLDAFFARSDDIVQIQIDHGEHGRAGESTNTLLDRR